MASVGQKIVERLKRFAEALETAESIRSHKPSSEARGGPPKPRPSLGPRDVPPSPEDG